MQHFSSLYNFLQRYSLILSLVWLIALFLLFFPVKSVTIDEYHYLTNSYRILDNTLQQPCDPAFPGQFPYLDFCLSKYNIGTSFFFLPAPVLHTPQLAFLVIFAFTALSIVLFYSLLKELRLNVIFTYLLAFYPAVVFYSRTTMSEPVSMFFITLTAWAVVRSIHYKQTRYALLIGSAIGLGTIVRYTNVVVFCMLGLIWLWQIWSPKRAIKAVQQVAIMCLAGLPFAVFLLWFNTQLYGNALRSGYYFAGEEKLVITNLGVFLIRYLVMLGLVYPGLIFASIIHPFFKRGVWLARVLAIPAFLSIAFYSISANSLFTGNLIDMITGIRFLVPVIPLLLLPYSDLLGELITRHLLLRKLFVVAICLLALSTLVISIGHQRFLLADTQTYPDPEIYFHSELPANTSHAQTPVHKLRLSQTA